MINKIISTFFITLFSSTLFAQAQETTTGSSSAETLIYVIVGLVLLISVLVLLVSIYTLYVVRTILKKDEKEKEETEEAEGEEIEESKSLWKKISKSLTKAKPVEEEEDILLDHSYDGIRELDNHLPPWWKWLFYITIFWSVIYLLVYHVFNLLPLSGEQFQASLASAEAEKELRMAEAPGETFTEANVTLATEAANLEEGETIFNRQCAVCHRQDGGGSVGPNLTDNYWIHGGSIKNLYAVIKNGVPQQGMISWESQLSPAQMRNVASYIKSELVGTNPPNPKEPQGELYEPEQEEQQGEEEPSGEEQESTESDTTQVASK